MKKERGMGVLRYLLNDERLLQAYGRESREREFAALLDMALQQGDTYVLRLLLKQQIVSVCELLPYCVR